MYDWAMDGDRSICLGISLILAVAATTLLDPSPAPAATAEEIDWNVDNALKMGRSGVSRAKNEKNSILIVKRRACRNLSKAAKVKRVAAPCCDVDAK